MRKLVFGLLASLAIAAPAAAAQKVLTVSTWGGPNHGINTIVWPTWKKWIEEATDNRVTLEVVHDMGPPAAQMDLVVDGVADVTWYFHGYAPGRFEATKLPEFPTFVDYSAEAASVAYWRTHKKYLEKVGEHRGVEVIALGVHGPGQIFARTKITSLADLKGKRIRVGGGVMSEITNKLGVVGVPISPTSVYEAGSQGVIDGAMLTLEGLRSFRVAEVMPTTLTLPGGFYRASFSIMMNPDTWASLPARDREAIESVSGEKLARLFGYMMDVADQRGIEFAKEQGNTFVELSAEDQEQLKELTKDLSQTWVKKVSRRLPDAEEALEYYRTALAEAAELPSIAPETIEVRP
ncbi:MAG: TRAP transporter substrate-binding protein [Xanthomonadaceae bacterium]|nr:TRAP transporter substrate-binding protein [Xanthomonadaceae bacterium]